MVDFSSLSGFKAGAMGLTSYVWVLYIFVPIAVIIFLGVMWKTWNDKKKQWTHVLRVKRELVNGELSKEVLHKMKRFPLIKNCSVFELEKPVLGSYLISELDSYTGLNEFTIIIAKNNRIYISLGERFDPEKSSVNVSAKHAGIDLAFDGLKSDWQNIHKENKRVDLMQMAKFALYGLLIIAVMVVAIKGIGQWGENHQIDAQKAAAEVEAFRNLADAMETSQATMNTQVIILDLLKERYGTNNIQGIIREKTNATA